MTPNARMEGCPDPRLLLSLLDEELEPSLRETLGTHVDGCERCADVLRAAAARSAKVSAWLSRHDPPVPEPSEFDLRLPTRAPFRWPWWPWWAMAATVVLAVAVAAGPARAWLLGRLGLGGTLVTQTDDGPGIPPAAATAFVPRGGVVTIGFDAGVTGRTLAVIRSADTLAAFDATSSETEVVVGPDRFDVHDASGSPMAYRLSVPVTVTTVRIRVDGAEDVIVRPEESARVVTIPAGRR